MLSAVDALRLTIDKWTPTSNAQRGQGRHSSYCFAAARNDRLKRGKESPEAPHFGGIGGEKMEVVMLESASCNFFVFIR